MESDNSVRKNGLFFFLLTDISMAFPYVHVKARGVAFLREGELLLEGDGLVVVGAEVEDPLLLSFLSLPDRKERKTKLN